MKTPLSTTTKVGMLVILGILFGATLIALSLRTERPERSTIFGWGGSLDRESKKVNQTFTVQPGGQLVIDADMGEISVTGSDIQELRVLVTIRGSEEFVRLYTVDLQQDDQTVRIRGELGRRFFRFFSDDYTSVHYEIMVPTDFNLDIQTSGGNMIVTGVKGVIEGSTSGGDVDLERLDGTVRVSTSGGNVSLSNATGEFKLGTSGGNIEGESITGPLEVETSGGNITLRNTDGRLIASTSGGDIRVFAKDNKGIDLQTSGGNVLLKLPRTTAGTIEAETTGGDVTCDIDFSGKIKDGRMKGKINGGGNMIRLESSGGNIDITFLD